MTVVDSSKQQSNRQLRADSFDSSLGWGSDEEQEDLLQNEEALNGTADTMEEPRGCLSRQNNLLCRGNSQVSDLRVTNGEMDEHNSSSTSNNHNQHHQWWPVHLVW